MDKKKKITLFGIGGLELAIVLFALIVSIIVLATYNDPATYGNAEAARRNLELNGPMIGFFQNNSTAFFCIILIPVFVILVLDIIYLVAAAVKRESNLSKAEADAIREQAKAEARAEVLKEMQAESEKHE